MRKIIIAELLTVDGLISCPDNGISWANEMVTDEIIEDFNHQFIHTDTILLGRITFEMLRQYCTGPVHEKQQSSIIDFFTRMKKIVFSRTLPQPGWPDTIICRELDRRTIRQCQQQPGNDITVIGSASIAQALINLGMVNEFQFIVHPMLLGEGKPLFRKIRERHALTPIRTDMYKNGVLHLSYHAFTG